MRIYGTGILKSMLIAYRNMLRKPITVQYPQEKVVLPERARWAVAMKYDENGDIKCTGCLACERACPDYIIEMQMTTAEDRSKHIDHYRYEIGACMMCGLCVEACPFDAIEMSHDYELARIDSATLTIDLVTDTPAAVAKKRTPAAPAAGGKPAAAPPSSASAETLAPAPEAPAAETPAPAETIAEPEGGSDV